jgi:hypothetical protein
MQFMNQGMGQQILGGGGGGGGGGMASSNVSVSYHVFKYAVQCFEKCHLLII